MSSGSPFKEIIENEDRAWSLRLVDELARGVEEDREQIIKALSCLNDTRVEKPLLALVLDSEKAENVRKAASDALFECGSYNTAEERTHWWESNDPVIVRHALLMSEPSEATRVKSIAVDPLHSLYHAAIRTIEFWELPEFQKLVIRALDHPEPRVRKTAAKCLLWEQPVAAETKLLELARDAHEDVAIAALDTLIYCASREILIELDNLQRNGPLELRDCYETTFKYVQKEFAWCIPDSSTDAAEKKYMTDWLRPVKHLLKKGRDKPSKSRRSKRSKTNYDQKSTVTARSIIEDLSEADGKWLHKRVQYYGVDWTAFNDADRLSLKQFFKHHADPSVRTIGCRAHLAWNDGDAVLSGMHDHDYSVRRLYAYGSRFLEPSRSFAERLKEIIDDHDVMNSLATEALESYVHHANASEILDWLLDLAQNDPRPSIRYTAAQELHSSEAHVKKLIPILSEPPANTWDLHLAILRGCERSWVSESTLEYLQSIDNVSLQRELASFVTS